MSNMSYCRFQNTLRDFRDCANALRELEAGNESPLSDDELAAAKDLLAEAADLLEAVLENTGTDAEMSVDADDVYRAVDAIQEQAEDMAEGTERE